MARIVRLSLLLVAAACRARTAVPAEAVDAGLASLGDAGSMGDAGWPLTQATVDAWLRYQGQVMVKLDAGTIERARRERAIRVDAGLSEEEVDAVEDVVAAVVTARNIAKITGGDAMREFEKVTAALPASLRAKAPGVAATLDAEKARFGEAAVSAVVAREIEVTKVWDALVEAKDPR